MKINSRLNEFVGEDFHEEEVMTPEEPINRSVVVESEPSIVADVCSLVLSELEENGFSKDDVFAVHLALGEAFVNAVEHGNKMAPDKKVTINYSMDSDKVEVSVSDDGEGFNPEVVPDPRCGVNLYRPQGRGLLLIHSYMDVVKFNERGNTIHMARYRERPRLIEDLGPNQA